MPPETNQTTQPTSSPTFFGVDPTQISDPQGQTFYKAWTNAQQNPDSPLASSFIQGVKSGQYNDMAQAAGIDMTKYPQIFQSGVSAPSGNGGIISDIDNIGNTRATQIASAIEKPAQVAESGGSPLKVREAVGEAGLNTAGAVAGGIADFIGEGIKAITPQPVLDFLNSRIQNNKQLQAAAKNWSDFATAHPEAAEDLGSVFNVGALTVGGEEAKAAETPLTNASGVISNAVDSTKQAVADTITKGADTKEAIRNIAGQEGGIVAPTKTASQVAQESQQSTWDVIKPKLSPDELKTAAANGGLIRTGENGVLTQVPTTKDISDINLAQPYVEAAGGDPVKAAANIKQGIADEAQQLRSAVQNTKGGTFSTSNIKGVLNDVNIPSAIKGGAEMNQINNIKDFVTSIADKVDKNPGGALDLAQQFRQTVNSDFGENVWGKSTPIGNYIKSVNKALNDFISTRLPNGTLPDGTLIKDSFAKQTQLYNIYDNIQIPKVGDQLVTPTEEAPLKDPGSPLEQTIAKHPVATKVIKTVGEGVGLGGIIKHIP